MYCHEELIEPPFTDNFENTSLKQLVNMKQRGTEESNNGLPQLGCNTRRKREANSASLLVLTVPTFRKLLGRTTFIDLRPSGPV
jgi:hypothetical protein